jgi:hypothetical protein
MFHDVPIFPYCSVLNRGSREVIYKRRCFFPLEHSSSGPCTVSLLEADGSIGQASQFPLFCAQTLVNEPRTVDTCSVFYRKRFMLGWKAMFCRCFCPHSLLSSGYHGLFLGVKGLGREADHSPPSSAEVKNAWSCTSTFPLMPSWRGAQFKRKGIGTSLPYLTLPYLTFRGCDFNLLLSFADISLLAKLLCLYMMWLWSSRNDFITLSRGSHATWS